MAEQAAAGVMHLHKEKVVHRDLALRNLLVDSGWNIRISDFGLSRTKIGRSARTMSKVSFSTVVVHAKLAWPLHFVAAVLSQSLIQLGWSTSMDEP